MFKLLILFMTLTNIFAVSLALFFVFKLLKNDGIKYINTITIFLLISNIILITGFNLFYFEEKRVLPFFQFLIIPLGFSYGPLVFLYSKAVAKGQKRFRERDYFHFLPYFIVVAVLIVKFSSLGYNFDEARIQAETKYKDQVSSYMIFVFLSWVFYLLLSLSHYFKFLKSLQYDRNKHNDSIRLYIGIILGGFFLVGLANAYCFIYHFSAKMVMLIAFITSSCILAFGLIARINPHRFWHHEFRKEHNKKYPNKYLYY